MTNVEISYIAGIIDGEGSIMLIKFHNNQLPAPCISISSTTLELLIWIKEKTSMGKIVNKRLYKDYYKKSYSYLVTHDNAINLLKLIIPYLVINSKKQRAELILNEYKTVTKRNGKYTESEMKVKDEFYSKFISICLKIMILIQFSDID